MSKFSLILFLGLMSLSVSSLAAGGSNGETDVPINEESGSESGTHAIDDPFGKCCSDREQSAMLDCVNGEGTESPGRGTCADKMATAAGVVGSKATSNTNSSGNEE